ncbi:MAG TPA: hypothetical protein VK424_08800 [Thermoplasmata archaeon]|nr:hypothetical protein [Thermoplasmata archaeon]
MSLVNEPDRLPEAVLDELVRSLRADLEETEDLVRSPKGRVLDPASLVTAGELIEGARAVLDRSGPRSKAERAAEANLAYAVMLSVIDLVKSHTDVPRVPPPRKTSGA